MNSTEIDALVEHIGGTDGFDLDPLMLEMVIRSELESNWDSIPAETRAVMLHTASVLRRLLQPASITGRAISEAFAEIALALQSVPRGGRKPGAVARTTEHICEVIDDMGGADAVPSEVLSEVLARAADGESPYQLDGAIGQVLYERGVDGEITFTQILTKIYSAKSRYFTSIGLDRRKRDIRKKLGTDL